MNAIPYDSPQEDWDRYQDENSEEPLPGRPHRQLFNRKSAALTAAIAGAVCFYAGVRVEKSQVSGSTTTALSTTTGASSRAGAGGLGARAAAAGAGSGGGAAALFGGRSFSGGGASAGGGASLGTVSSINRNTFYVTETSGNMIKVKLSSATNVTKSVTVGKSAVRPGDTVVIRGLNSNGTLNATTVSDSGAGAAGFGAGGSSSGSSGSPSSGNSGSGNSAVNSLFGSGNGG